jgi:hypothetical protein
MCDIIPGEWVLLFSRSCKLKLYLFEVSERGKEFLLLSTALKLELIALSDRGNGFFYYQQHAN